MLTLKLLDVFFVIS